MNNLIGKKFGKLIVLKRASNSENGRVRWSCKCSCGNKKEILVLGYSLTSGHTKSCGCWRKEKTKQRFTTHGHTKNGKITGFYDSWRSMVQRCVNPSHKRYKDYGGRGISICGEWMEFPNFKKDMIKSWEPGLTLERRNNELGYFKGNCYWATPKEQARNRRNNLYVPYNGKNRLLVELCEEHNMPYNVVYNRFYNYGWTLREALKLL